MRNSRFTWSGLRSFGFSLQWAWVCVSLYSALLYSSSSNPLQYIEIALLVQASSSTITLLIFALYFRYSRIGKSKGIRYFVIIGSFLGTVLMFFGSAIGSVVGIVLFVSGVIVSSVVNSALLVLWSEHYSQHDTQTAMKYVSLSIAIGTILALGITILPNFLGIIVVSVLPCTSLLMLPSVSSKQGETIKDNRYLTSDSGFEKADPSINQASSESKGSSRYPLPPALMVGLVIYGVAFGLIPGLFSSDIEVFLDTSKAGLFFIAATALVFAVLCYVLPKRFRFDLMAKIVLPLCAAGFILLPVGNGPLAYGFMKAGETLFDMVFWVVMLDAASCSKRYSAASIFSWGRFASHAGRIVGFVLVFTISASFSFDNVILGVIALVVVYALILTNTFVFDWKSFFSRKGLHRNPSASEAEIQQKMIQEKYSLSPREAEVLPLIAKGRSAPHIAKQLGIAESTVKTHTYHIYDKVGVATKQELLDRIDSLDVSQYESY